VLGRSHQILAMPNETGRTVAFIRPFHTLFPITLDHAPAMALADRIKLWIEENVTDDLVASGLPQDKALAKITLITEDGYRLDGQGVSLNLYFPPGALTDWYSLRGV